MENAEFDEDLVLYKVRQGNERAFGQIYDQYLRMVSSVLRKIARCPRSEMDFHVNEVFFRVYKGVFSFQGNSKFSTYVYRIALNYSFQLSKKLRKDSQTLTEIGDEDSPVHFDQGLIDTVVLEKALDQLSINLRSVVVMFYYDRMSVKEISEVEQISENAVKNRLFQARDKLKKILQEAGYAFE